MYCPKCGIQNNDETKFCRGCGENLKVVLQAMSRRLPVILVSRVDAYLERKNERFRRDSILGAIVGSLWLLYGVKTLAAGEGTSTGFRILMGCLVLLWSLWQHMVYKRSLFNMEKMRAEATIDGPSEHDPALIAEPPASITEFTTKHLDRKPENS